MRSVSEAFAKNRLNECLAGEYKLKGHEIWTTSEYIRDEAWQKVRVGMKGTTTNQKLSTLQTYIRNNGFDRKIVVQVQNYVNALKRGGQLSLQGEILR